MSARDILYAPDFVINAGRALAGVEMEIAGRTRAQAEERVVQRITDALHRIFAISKDEGITTVEAAQRLARERVRSTA